LPGVSVKEAGANGDVICFYCAYPDGADRHYKGDLYRSVQMDGETMTLANGGQVVFEPLGAPRYLCVTELETSWVTLMWEMRHGDPDEFVIERRVRLTGPFDVRASWPASNRTCYADATVSPDTDYCYGIMAVKDGITHSEYTHERCVKTPVAP
jgi:hypothetical protein